MYMSYCVQCTKSAESGPRVVWGEEQFSSYPRMYTSDPLCCVSCCVIQGFEATAEDSVVPHTPVLEGGKQLGMPARAQSLPTAQSLSTADRPQPTASSLASQTLQAPDCKPLYIALLNNVHLCPYGRYYVAFAY